MAKCMKKLISELTSSLLYRKNPLNSINAILIFLSIVFS
jgi:hypothetical protein